MSSPPWSQESAEATGSQQSVEEPTSAGGAEPWRFEDAIRDWTQHAAGQVNLASFAVADAMINTVKFFDWGWKEATSNIAKIGNPDHQDSFQSQSSPPQCTPEEQLPLGVSDKSSTPSLGQDEEVCSSDIGAAEDSGSERRTVSSLTEHPTLDQLDAQQAHLDQTQGNEVSCNPYDADLGPLLDSPFSSAKREYWGELNKLLDDLLDMDLTEYIFDQTKYFNARGGSCDVFVAKLRRHGNMAVAVKSFRLNICTENRLFKTIFRELRVWSSLNHPNVLPLLGYVMHGNYPALVSKWMTRGSVWDYLRRESNISIMNMAKGISAGLAYLHDLDIIHSDLKSDNIFMSESEEPLLADFGISRIMNATKDTTSTDTKGSTRWMAIEFFSRASGDEDHQREHTKPTDIWALGMVFYELLTRSCPFYETKNEMRVLFLISEGQLPTRPQQLDGEEAQLLWLLSQECWKSNPCDRPTIASICARLNGRPHA